MEGSLRRQPLSNIKITDNAAALSHALSEMKAGHFYRRKSDGQLVFAASRVSRFDPVRIDGLAPDDSTPVVAIGQSGNGYVLKGLFGEVEDYEEVDVEIVVTRK